MLKVPPQLDFFSQVANSFDKNPTYQVSTASLQHASSFVQLLYVVLNMNINITIQMQYSRHEAVHTVVIRWANQVNFLIQFNHSN